MTVSISVHALYLCMHVYVCIFNYICLHECAYAYNFIGLLKGAHGFGSTREPELNQSCWVGLA